MQRTLISTSDGSHTIFVDELNETYHSSHGAVQEAMHVFIQHGLKYIEAQGRDELNIFEMGFGTGLNAWLTAVHTETLVNYTGIEAFPVEKELLNALNYTEHFPAAKGLFKDISEAEWGSKIQISSQLSLAKVQEKIQHYTTTERFDLIYFDAFGPRAQGEMWEMKILKKMVEILKDGGVLVTYCAQGQFRRNLRSLGCEIEVLPGPPGKREMTRAVKIRD